MLTYEDQTPKDNFSVTNINQVDLASKPEARN